MMEFRAFHTLLEPLSAWVCAGTETTTAGDRGCFPRFSTVRELQVKHSNLVCNQTLFGY